jgi:hypothetical protein
MHVSNAHLDSQNIPPIFPKTSYIASVVKFVFDFLEWIYMIGILTICVEKKEFGNIASSYSWQEQFWLESVAKHDLFDV